jgi:hypothetical protein
MRVRPKRTTDHHRKASPARRLRTVEAVRAPEPAPPAEDRAQERRVRESGGPIDRAHYACACGFVFEADVSTSVSCPHCGAGQAW